MHWLKAIRPLNLFIIAALQFVLYYKLFILDSEPVILQGHYLFLLIFITILITLSGYLINDRFDTITDQVNSKRMHALTSKQLLFGYIGTVGLGAALSIYLALNIAKPFYFLLFPIAVAILYFYSAFAKGKGMLGNLIVAVFCGCGLLVLGLAEYPTLRALSLSNQSLAMQKWSILIGISLMAFLVTLIRELVKDVEDLAGDHKAGFKTFAVKAGPERVRLLVQWYLILAIILSVLWVYLNWQMGFSLLSTVVFGVSVLPLLILAFFTSRKAFTHGVCKNLSTLLKSVMIASILYVILL